MLREIWRWFNCDGEELVLAENIETLDWWVVNLSTMERINIDAEFDKRNIKFK